MVQILIFLVTKNKTRENYIKLNQRRFSLDIRKRFFTRGYWNRLPRAMVTGYNEDNQILSTCSKKYELETVSGGHLVHCSCSKLGLTPKIDQLVQFSSESSVC